jgi:hypothetical protein
MVNINLAENTRVYILKKEKNPGVATPVVADYYDFTGYLTKIKAKKKINDLGTIEVEFGGIDTTALRDYVKAGNYLFIITGYNDGSIKNKLIGKYLLEQPLYSNNGIVKIKGIQSSGKNSGNKQLTRTSTSYKIKHQNETLNTVLFGSQGVCKDSEGNTVITSGLDITSAAKEISINIDYKNRMELVNSSCDLAEVEWDIIHGVNYVTNPYSDGDELYVKEKLGTQTPSQYTFYLSGVNTNCYASRGAKTVSEFTNDIKVKGTDLSGQPIETKMFNGSQYDTTTINLSGFSIAYTSFDGWLIEDLSISGTIKINPGSFIAENEGEVIFLKINDEVIKGTVDTSDSDFITLTSVTRGVNTSTIIDTLQYFPFDTKSENHKAGSDVVIIRDYNAIGTELLTVDLPLTDRTNFSSVGYVYIGSELVINLGNSLNAGMIKIVRINTSGSSSEQLESWNNSYAHSGGIRVMEATQSGGGYVTSDNPYSGSNIDINGLYSQVFTEESGVNKDSLDKKCQLLLENRSDVDNIVELEVDNPEKFFVDIAVGDAVSIDGAEVINLDDSGASPTFRYVEYEYTWPPNRCIVYLNRIERKNEFNTGNSLTEDYTKKTPEIANNTTRSNEFNNYELPEEAGGKKVYDFFNKEINGVVIDKDYASLTDEDNNKAVNVGLLKEAITASSSLFETYTSSSPNDSVRTLSSNINIIPKGTSSLGDNTNIWDSVYSSYIHTAKAYFEATAGNEDYYIDYFASANSVRVVGDEDAPDGSSSCILIQFKEGNLSTGTVLPRVEFTHSLLVLQNESNANIESNTAYSGSIYYNTTTSKIRWYDGISWSDLGSDSSLWETSSSGIRPITSGYDIIPNGTADLGTSSLQWSSGYITSVYSSVITTTYIYNSSGTSTPKINIFSDEIVFESLTTGVTLDDGIKLNINTTGTNVWSIYGGSSNLIIIPSVSGEEVQIGSSTYNADLLLPNGYLQIQSGEIIGKLTLSTSTPSGGSNGDVWFKY